MLTAIALFSTTLHSVPAFAGGVVAGATEFTQIANNIQLVAQYMKQVQQYATQLQQYQAQLQNLVQNPFGALGIDPGVSQLIGNIGTVMSATNAIGNTMKSIDSNFASTFQNPLAASFADKFKGWTDTTLGTLNAAMKGAGLQRESFATDTQALQALFKQSQSSTGTVAAVQQLSALTSMQIQQTQKLGDLLSSQTIAASTWMAAQTSKQQADQDRASAVAGPLVSVPTSGGKSDFAPMPVK